MNSTIARNRTPARAAPSNHGQSHRIGSRKTSSREQLILFALGHHERYGLAIQSAIAECSNGRESITIGSLYPTLQSLERKGLVESRAGSEVSNERCDRKRKYFRLSDEGKEVLAEIIAFQERLLSRDS